MDMFDNIYMIAALWIGLALAASLISIRVGIAVALVEIFMGLIAGNFLGVQTTNQWIDFLAAMGSLSLTFLAGSEIDPQSFKANLKASLVMGLLSFALPFISVWMLTQHVFGWELHQAQIAGIALSTTSVAVVYSVMIEKGLSDTSVGKLILAACFVTDLGTVLALGVLFANFNMWMLLFVAAMAAAVFVMPRLIKIVAEKYGSNKVSEPGIKLILLILLLLAGLAAAVGSEAVLPAYIMGLAAAEVFMNNKVLVNRIRTMAFTVFTPFYFIKAGLYVSLKVLLASLGVIVVLLLLKVFSKIVGVWPVSRAAKLSIKLSNYTTLLMSTGLTFGSISALYGLNNHIINQDQYTILVTVVILSAVVPTLIAQTFFEPSFEEMNTCHIQINNI